MSEEREWRVSWEAIMFGTDWHPSERVTSDEADARDQYDTLREWERTGEEPIRNVRLERREPSEWKAASSELEELHD